MSPVSNPSFDHSYELPIRRNLLLLLDLLGLLRFIAAVLLDRLGVAPYQGEVPWGGGEDDDASDAALERVLEATLREIGTGTRSLTATTPRYRLRRSRVTAQPAADDNLLAADDEDAAAVCAICLAELEGFETVVELCGCSHAFHAACVDAWVGSSGDDAAASCPLCRAPMLRTPWDDGQSLARAQRPCD